MEAKKTAPRFVVYAFLIVLFSAIFSWSQATTSLRGTVTDPSGGVVPGAKVVLSNPDLQIDRAATTGGEGEYEFVQLPPGTYTLTVISSGFSQYEQKGLALLVNTPARANVQLKVGATKEVVEVSSEAPPLNTVDASIGSPFSEHQIKQIPLEGRNVPDLLSLQAGVSYTGNRPDNNSATVKDQDSRNGAVNGARSDQSNITLDGVDVNDQAKGYAFTSVLPVTLDSVEEFRVTTTNYNADQGEGSGAQVSLVTKSGTNSLHGSVYEYNRNTFTSANDYFVKGAEARLGQPNQPDKLIRNIFGASMGGPFIKDRFFFFGNYEGTRDAEQQSTIRVIPTPTMCQGILQYVNTSGGVTTVTPAQLKALDPTGLGLNPAMLNPQHTGYLDTTFCTGQFVTNDNSVGDGFNYSGFRFRAPVSLSNNAFITRLDYKITQDGKHTIFWRGALQNLNNPQAPFLPGSQPEETFVDHSKGSVVGYTWVVSPTKVNSFHWGFTRQSAGVVGDSHQPWNFFYGLDQGVVYSHNAQTPTHNLLDDFSWVKGTHTIQMGTNVGFARDPRLSFEHSFSSGNGATNWMSPTGFANTGGGYLDPANIGLPEPASSPAYDLPVLALLGMVSDMRAVYNYNKDGSLIAPGTGISRNYGLNWYEFYGQDSWRVKPNLTVTYGLRWSLFPPPWEVNGLQASPTCIQSVQISPFASCGAGSGNLGAEFNQTAANMNHGVGYYGTPLVSFILGGQANNGPGFYHFSKSDFSPRVAIAYSPRPSDSWLKTLFGTGDKTVIRAGFGKVYDRAGLQLLSTFDANAPGGLSTTIQNPCCIFGYDDAANVPRISNINQVPQNGVTNQLFLLPAPSGAFPQTPPYNIQTITWGIDQNLKTPYSYSADFSIGRELPGRMSLNLAYVGRFGHNLLTQRDLRNPLDVVDPKTGIDYFSAATRLSQLARQGYTANQITNQLVGPTAQFWTDMLPSLVPGATQYTSFSGLSFPTLIQAVYDLYYNQFLSYAGNEVVGIGDIDLYGGLGDNLGNHYYFNQPNGQPCIVNSANYNNSFFPFGTFVNSCAGDFLNEQATSMFAWSSIGRSNYNALQATLGKQLGSGVQFDFNYTYSKSIDITSNATRLGFSSSTNVGAPGSRLVNPFNLGGRRGVSDFDTTHQVSVDWIAEAPFGKGKYFAHDASSLTDAFIGGWQLSGVARWTSGFPFTVDNGNFWPTNWDEQGIAQLVGNPQTGHFVQPDGTVSAFANPGTAFTDFVHPFPGGSGSRNVVRGDGYAGLDMALAKRWILPIETQSLQFRWEVFNVPNLHRFNVASGIGTSACTCIASLQQQPSKFGDYTGLLTEPRVMQFALRYEF
jgi:hypothetical protein